jgi:5-formyltetrahydrofolate cyclo-ligase
MEINAAKMELRERMRAAFDNDTHAEASAVICGKLRALPEWRAARVVMAFAPLGDEPNIEPLLCATRTTALPRWTGEGYEPARVSSLIDDLHTGQFGVREPKPACAVVDWSEIDVMLVPGLAFDTEGNRLGRGGGFYDRLLDSARAKGSVTAIGVAFDWQRVNSVPVEKHDRKLNLVISP